MDRTRAVGHALHRFLELADRFVEIRLQLAIGLGDVRRHPIGQVLGRQLGQTDADRIGDDRPLLFDRLPLRLFVAFALTFRLCAVLRRLTLETRILDRRIPKHEHGLGHLADLVGAILGGNLDRLVALGQVSHRLRHAGQRPRDHPSEDQPDSQDHEQAPEERAGRHQQQKLSQGGNVLGRR